MTVSLSRKLIFPALILAIAAGLYVKFRSVEDNPAFMSGNGRLEATEVDVATKMAGRIVELLPREGDAVKKGQVLARLDVADLQAQAAEARAQVEQARASVLESRASLGRQEADLSLARSNLERTRQLVAKKFISPERLERDENVLKVAEATLGVARSKLSQSDAAVEAAKARVARMEALLADASLPAPIDGRVLYRLVEPGEVLGAGGKLLTLLDLSDVYMTVYLPTEMVGRLALGDEARILLDGLPDVAVPARIGFVADKAQFTPREVETRTEREKLMFRVKLKVDGPWLAANAARVKPGMPGVAWLRTDPNQAWPQKLGKQ